jgi:two-component system sensor histidine kinase KdpD
MNGWRGYALATAAVAAASVVVALLGPLHLANGSMVYLGAVLVVAILAGRGPSIAASVGAFAAFNYLFTEPRFTFAVTDPEVVLALAAFLVIAIVTSQLAAELRDRAVEAAAREREARLLHDTATLLATRPLADALEGIGERLRGELGIPAVGIDLAGSGTRGVVAGDLAALGEARGGARRIEILGQAVPSREASPGGLGRWRSVHRLHAAGAAPGAGRLYRVPITTRDGPIDGSLDLLVRSAAAPGETFTRIVSTAAGQIALAAEQDRLRRVGTEAELLRRTDELRGRLLDAVSHDLRTPLASIIAAAGSLQQTDVSWTDEDVREFASAIEHEAGRLTRIVGNLLDLGRIRDGSIVPAREWHDPAIVVEDAIDRLRARLGDREITFVAAPGMPPVLLDAVEIDQVLANLVENAANASPAGVPIRVTAEVVEGELRVSVEDRGPGLPGGAADRLFEPFVRGEPRIVGVGTGLGLAVARGLVLAHGGRIWGENRSEGGARFAFALPAATLPEPEPT